MKQGNLFGGENKLGDDEGENKKYSLKVSAPLYAPKNKKPYVLELFDDSKSKRLIKEIEASNVTEDEKEFLILAAKRHVVFNYEKIADYYSNSPKEMQVLMEKSALVIIDFEKAIELGYVRLCDEIKNQYLQDYGE